MINRMIGVFRLDSNNFEEIEHDPDATAQAAIIVAIVSLLAAIGAGIGAVVGGESFVTNFLSTLVWTFLGWIVWAAISFFVGTTLFGGQADLGEMLRVIGFAYTPLVLGVIPCVGFIIGGIWALFAGFIAVRQGLDLDNTKAFLTVLVGFLVFIVGQFLLNVITGGLRGLIS